jgi:hypothetical protein
LVLGHPVVWCAAAAVGFTALAWMLAKAPGPSFSLGQAAAIGAGAGAAALSAAAWLWQRHTGGAADDPLIFPAP